MDLIITQLTDIHFKEENDLDILLKRTNSIVGAISETIINPSETLLLICVTGDVAYSGNTEEYAMAELFFEDIYDKIISRHNGLYVHFMFVPGNHDCDFGLPANKVRLSILDSNTIDMNDETTIKTCTSIQKNFFGFVNKFVDKKLASPIREESIFTQNIIVNKELGNYRIKVHCLNTAWCSVKKETKNMLFSVPEQIDEKEEDDIVITLMHHGENWFDWEGLERWSAYHREYSDIILVGHEHYKEFVHRTNYDSSSNYFIKGNQLYSTEEPNYSGFNIMKINLNDNVEFFYTYEWNGKVYERIIDSKAQKFERNRFSRTRVDLVKELKENLEDMEIDITSKYKAQVLLSDVYVFPYLRGERMDNPEKNKIYRTEEEILDIIKTKKHIIINGNREYGKTALTKRLFMIYYEQGVYPVYIHPDNVKSSDEDLVNNLIREAYDKSYTNLNVDEIMQMLPEKRMCIIDDYNEITLSDKSQKMFLKNIIAKFGTVILTINSKSDMLDAAKNLETKDFLRDNFFDLEIRELKRYGKRKIIEKWLLLEDPEQDINSQQFDAKRKNKMSQMKNVLKNGYFSNTPLEFLLVLTYLDNSETMNTDYSRYSFIYDCLIREKINEISNKNTKVALAYRTLLEILAYNLYAKKENVLFEEESLILAISDYNENYNPIQNTKTKIIQQLVQYKILEERGEKYKFKYNYMYYYFAGSYIIDNMSPDEKDKKIFEIMSDLSNETNYNIALFIAYSVNTEYEVLPKIKDIESRLLPDFENFRYEDQQKLLEKINDNIIEKVDAIYKIPDNSQIPKIQEQKSIQQDEYDEIVSEIEQSNEDSLDANTEQIEKSDPDTETESLNIISADFSKLIRLIEFQGDILKNYASKIKNTPRKQIIENMGASNLKLMGFLCDWMSGESDKIIEIVERKAKEVNKDKSPEKELLIYLIKDFIGFMWSDFVELNVNNLAYCWDCDALEKDISEYKEKMQSAFFDMVNIEYKMKISDDKLPVSDIERCLLGKRKLGSFSKGIMKKIVASYLSTYQYDSTDKERVCSLLGYDYKKLYIKEQKEKMLGEI